MKKDLLYKIFNTAIIVILTIMIIINMFRQELLWVIIDLQIIVFYVIVDDIKFRTKKESLNDEMRFIQTKALIKILNLLEASKNEEPKKRGRKSKSE